MIIVNQSGAELTINSNKVAPVEEYDITEMMFNTVNIHSDIGSVEITTEYGKRSFECFGQLRAYESDYLKDKGGLAQIIVVNTMPTGEWVMKGLYNMYYCSNCRGGGYAHYKFCPHCGLTMKVGEP